MTSKPATIQQLLATASALLEEARRLSTPNPKPRPRRRPAPLPSARATDEEVAKCFADIRAMLTQ